MKSLNHEPLSHCTVTRFCQAPRHLQALRDPASSPDPLYDHPRILIDYCTRKEAYQNDHHWPAESRLLYPMESSTGSRVSDYAKAGAMPPPPPLITLRV